MSHSFSLSMKYILIWIKFNIDINNGELLKIICQHKAAKKNWLSLVVRSSTELKCNMCHHKYHIWYIVMMKPQSLKDTWALALCVRKPKFFLEWTFACSRADLAVLQGGPPLIFGPMPLVSHFWGYNPQINGCPQE